MPLNIPPGVVFLRTEPFENFDVRRSMSGVAGDFGFPFQIRQIKVIEFSEDAVRNRLTVGNHRYSEESGQWKLLAVLGDDPNPVFCFHYRDFHSEVKEKLLKGGDVAVVPPGCSSGFVALKPGAKLFEISNLEFKSENCIKDELF